MCDECNGKCYFFVYDEEEVAEEDENNGEDDVGTASADTAESDVSTARGSSPLAPKSGSSGSVSTSSSSSSARVSSSPGGFLSSVTSGVNFVANSIGFRSSAPDGTITAPAPTTSSGLKQYNHQPPSATEESKGVTPTDWEYYDTPVVVSFGPGTLGLTLRDVVQDAELYGRGCGNRIVIRLTPEHANYAHLESLIPNGSTVIGLNGTDLEAQFLNSKAELVEELKRVKRPLTMTFLRPLPHSTVGFRDFAPHFIEWAKKHEPISRVLIRAQIAARAMCEEYGVRVRGYQTVLYIVNKDGRCVYVNV